MARIVFGMNVSLDGYVDHEAFAPGPELFRHWIDHVQSLTGSLYGRRLYEIMRYWDKDDPAWGSPERAFALAWRKHPKWVVSTTLTTVGPNATLIRGNVEVAVRGLKADHEGEIGAGGTILAQSLSGLGLIDEYRLYYHPVVLGRGTPFFADALPKLRLLASDRVGEDTIRLAYAPA